MVSILSGHGLEVDLSDDVHPYHRDHGGRNNKLALSCTPQKADRGPACTAHGSGFHWMHSGSRNFKHHLQC